VFELLRNRGGKGGTLEQTAVETSPLQVRQIVEHLHACYEVWPEWAMVNDRRVQVGFELDLCANAGRPGGGPDVEVYDELKQIAAFVLPHDPGDAEFDVLPFDSSFHESARRGFRPEIVLALRILHRHGFDQPVDPCEEGCLRQIEGALTQLGIHRAH
jgi:hypothetical protein